MSDADLGMSPLFAELVPGEGCRPFRSTKTVLRYTSDNPELGPRWLGMMPVVTPGGQELELIVSVIPPQFSDDGWRVLLIYEDSEGGGARAGTNMIEPPPAAGVTLALPDVFGEGDLMGLSLTRA